MRYNYKAVAPGGRETLGNVEAESLSNAEELLWQADLTVVELKEARKPFSIQEALPTLYGIKKKDLINFSRDLSTLLASGISIMPSLRMLLNQTRKLAMKKVIAAVIKDLETGSSFHQACSAHPQVFPQFYLRLIRIAEEAGNLELILRQLTGYMEKEQAVVEKIRSALAYPIFVSMVATVAVILMLTMVLPAMQRLFREFRGQLPLITRILLALSSFLREYWWQILAAIILAIVILFRYTRSASGARKKDNLLLNLPLMKEIVLKSNLSRMARTNAMLLRAGVPLIEALELSVQIQGNLVLKDILSKVRNEVLIGTSISGAMAPYKIFPSLFYQMIAMGEETGRLEGNLESLAETYEKESDRSINTLVGLLEPAMIVLVGGFVAFIAISVVSPMYRILQEIK